MPTRTRQKPPPPRKATTAAPARRSAGPDPDRDNRALDYAARRVPVWQVSTTAALLTLRDADLTPTDVADRIRAVLAQVPAPVLRAATLHREGKWKPS